MRARFIFVVAFFACACGGSSSDRPASDASSDGNSDATSDATTDATYDTGVDTAPQPCASGETCVDVDVTTTKHTVSPLLFGDNIEWFQEADELWDPTTSAVRPAQLAILQTLGVTQLRYPGGTLSDFFHWQQAVGPVSSRTPQLNPFNSTATSKVTEPPLFGPDEFTAFAKAIGAKPFITANAATGTADEAAAWLADLESKGVDAKLWEIGNELWLNDDTWAGQTQTRTPAQYAAIFDAYAKALRAVDPSIQVGAIGCHPHTPLPLCRDPNWNQVLLSTVTQKIDFLAVHDAYAPLEIGLDPDEATVFRAMLGAPEGVRANLDAVEADVDAYAKPESKGLSIAVTEHASFFIPKGTDDTATFIATIQRNWTIASAIYSASIYRLFMSDPRIAIANHLPLNGPWECPVTESLADGVSSPFRTAFFHVFRSLVDGAGGAFVGSSVTGSPTFDSSDYGVAAGVKGAPSLLSLAVTDASSGKLYVWIINRDLATDVPARVVVRGHALPSTLSADVIDGPAMDSMNTSDAPTTIAPKTTTLSPTNDVHFTFPAHSLVRLTFVW